MTGKLLVRGMLLGLVAGLLSFGFLKLAGEPSVDRAIAFESAMEQTKADDAKAKGLPAPVEDPELVSRSVQAGIGLLTAVAVYSTAFGGIFALVFALAFRRMGDFGARATSALLAVAGFVSVYLVPMLKYPANPPSVGLAETIDMRTSLYFAMILISLAAMVGAGMLRIRLNQRFRNWNAALIATGVYVVDHQRRRVCVARESTRCRKVFRRRCCGNSGSRRWAGKPSCGEHLACCLASPPSGWSPRANRRCEVRRI